MKTSVIFTTYNSPDWLEKVLWGFFCQSRTDFEIIVADDGSTHEVAELIERMARDSPVSLAHVWQPDDGFQKCRILNKAIAVARGEYLIFTDGDCIPRRDFVETHLASAGDDRFLSGTYFKLPIELSRLIAREDIESQAAFRSSWLLRRGLKPTGKLLKLLAKPPLSSLLNRMTPSRPTFNGHSASCLREHVLAVNGFNESMQWGGLDVEFGLRLNNIGLRTQHIRYSTISLHLHHAHGYVTPEMRQRSAEIKERTRSLKLKRAENGIDQYLGSGQVPSLGSADRVAWLKS